MEQPSKKKTAKPDSPEFRRRAVWLAMEQRNEYQREAAARRAIAGKPGCLLDADPFRMRQVQHDGVARPGPARAEIARREH